MVKGVASRTRSKKVMRGGGGKMMGRKRMKIVNDCYVEVICLEESSESEGERAKNESGHGVSSSQSRAFIENGIEFLGEEEEEPPEVVEINDDDDDDGSDIEEEMHGEKKSFEVKVEVQNEVGKGCSDFGVKNESIGDRSDNPIVMSRVSYDYWYESDSTSSSSESDDDDDDDEDDDDDDDDDDETSDDDFMVDDHGVESEYSKSEESDSFYDDGDDDEREGYSKMAKERVKKFSEWVEEEQWTGVDADCGSATSSKSEIREEETKKAEEKYIAKRVESVNVDTEVFVDHCQSSGCSVPYGDEALEDKRKGDRGRQSVSLQKEIRDSTLVKKSGGNKNVKYCKDADDHEGKEHHGGSGTRVINVSSLPKVQEKIGDSAEVVMKENKKGKEPKDVFIECFGGKHNSVNGFSNELEKMSDESQTRPSASRKTVPSISNLKKAEAVERSESEKDINKLWDELDMLLQDEGNKSEINNNVNDKGKGVRRVSYLLKSQEKIGVPAKVVINKHKKEREHKHCFNSNNHRNKVRAVDDELYQVLRMPSIKKNRSFKFFTECFWGKQKDDDDVAQGEIEENAGDIYQGQTQPLASMETVPLKMDFGKKKAVEKSESEKELDRLWGEMQMLLRLDEIDSLVGNIGTTEARESQESNSQCKHSIIYDEEIGDFCRWCGWIETDIKYMWPKFADSEKSGRRVSSGEGNASKFDEALFHASGDDSEVVGSHNDGTIWDLIPPDVKEELFPHQKEGFEFIWKNLAGTTDLAKLKGADPCTEGGCIISHAPGTGKTRLTMVFLQTYLQLFPKCLPVIVAPANILLTWEDELKKWNIGIPFHNLNCAELSGKEQAINGVDWSGNQRSNKDAIRMVKLCSWYKEKSILLISYNMFEKLAGGKSDNDGEKEKKKGKMKKEKKRARIRKYIETAMGKVLLDYPGLLVLDEGHTPRNQQSCIWKVLSKSRTKKRVLLSGTPFQNNFLELYNILCLMKPSFPDSLPLELKKFCQSRLMQEKRASTDLSWEPIPSGNSAEEKINQLKLLMNPFVNAHTGSILQKKLPGLRDCVLVLKPDSLQQETLDSIECSQNGLNFEHKLALVSVHPSLFLNCSLSKEEESVVDKNLLERLRLNPYGGVKTKFLLEFLRLCDALDEKVLVFSQFIDTLNLIQDQLESAFKWSVGTEVLYMYGKLDQKQKKSIIHSFNDANSQAKVLLASTKASSEGINLIGASRVVLLDVVWNPSVERQAICRAYRLGQKKVVYTYHLLAQGTPECTKYCKQAEKNRLSELVFSNRNAESDKLKTCGVMFEDRVLDLMVQHENLKDMFGECVVQPKERDLETLGP